MYKDEQIFIEEDSSYSSFALAFPRDSIANLLQMIV
jgi:hypothetical protein